MNAALPLFFFLNLPTPTTFPHETKTLYLHKLVTAQLGQFEGFREAPYLDTQKQWTIGIGHKLSHEYISHAPITEQQALEMLRKDVLAAEVGACKVFPDFASLPPLAQEALIHMAFQLGTAGLAKFHNLKKAINRQDWPRAGAECIASRWAIQTPTRARFCAALFGKIKP